MKINGLGDGPKFERSLVSGSGALRPQQGPQARVTLSDLAGRLQQIEAEMGGAAPFDAARVEQITAAIREGRFKVNAGVVADRLIESMKELLASRP